MFVNSSIVAGVMMFTVLVGSFTVKNNFLFLTLCLYCRQNGKN